MNEQMSDQANNFGEGLFSKHGENDNVNVNEDEDEDEEEDVDFNPFLKGTPSPEASSSLSSEVEAFLDGNDSSKLKKKKKKKKTTMLGEVTNYDVGDIEHGEEVVMQAEVCPESEEEGWRKSKKRKIDFESQSEEGNVREKDDGASKIPEANVEDGDDEDEDAICKRTRARYSLASFTLDELETFLQETDDEDDLTRVDDEEEYRKFLAAVLHGGDGDGQLDKGNDNAEEEDEDNDADFEIELEELLESDVDDNSRDKCGTVEHERGGRRPETRQNKRQKASAQYKKKLLEQTKRPLRPLLPILPNGAITSFPTINGKALAPATASSYPSSIVEENLMNGFTLQQIGQLHCLIHEHMQLLIQVYSLCILDPSRQHIASQLQGLICEMLHKRDEVISSRSLPYPDICFRPPFACTSVSDELPNFYTTQCNFGPSMAPNMPMRDSENGSASNGRHDHALHEEMGSSQYASCFWMPHISGPVISILDVAPLNLVRTYMDDVYNAVRDYRQRHLDTSCDTRYEREPLFHLPCIPSVAEANSEVLRGNSPPAANNVPSTHGQQPKKTLAASIVESAKKQSIALVPRDISKLAQRFFSLFNPALFPHRPPPVAVANRVLFTDAEDELLALGIMEYNTDWKAIQQRFLPCKSTHQIFVRQKNRCSAKATENPIKAVRRMKTSPLSAKEIECIQEGLRVFKLDWTSVWKFAVPHRDPSLLPRQYRIALGTQRSYKLDAATKEKRRMYEAKRRRCKTEHLADWQQASEKEDNHVGGTIGENNSGDDCADNNVNEAYVHQAFLADWRPGASSLISSEQPSSNLREKDTLRDTLSREVSYIREQPNDYGPGANGLNRSPYTSRHCNYPPVTSPFTHFRHYPSSTMLPNHQTSDMTLNTSKSSQIFMWPYRTRRTDGARLVKLAPELPPVNLPPSVRVISQSAFKSNQSGASVKISATGGDTSAAGKGNLSAKNSAKTKKDKSNQVADHVTNLCPEESAAIHDTHAVEQRGTYSDLQMHPLLFKAPEYGRVPYYPLNYTPGTSNSFGFFSGNQPQLSLSLFHNPHQANHVIDRLTKSSKESNSASCGITFHPLLQRTDEDNSDLVMSCSNTDQIAQFQNPSGVVQIRPLVISSPFATYPKVSSLNEKANELDLEIHLSSTSVKEKTRGRRDVDANNQPRSPASTPKSGKAKGLSNSVLDVEASAVSGNDVTRCSMDDIGDQSHHEIVMEQEELSDSDEEIEEHVEFECEEMADSDGEDGSGCDYIPEVQEQESPSFAREKDAITSDDGDPQCQLRSPEHPQGNVPQISTPPFLKLCLTSLGKDATGSSWLSLDSCAPVDSLRAMAEHEEVVAGESATSKNLTSSRPNRSCKKVTQSMKGLAPQKDVVDMAQQLSLGPLAVSALRRPRRRACRTNTSVGMTMENSRNDQDKSS